MNPTQGDLFAAVNAMPASRLTDPPASRRAERKVSAMGIRSDHARRIYGALVTARPNALTAAEIGQRVGLDRYQVCRRLPELLRLRAVLVPPVARGDERVCTVLKVICGTWRVE